MAYDATITTEDEIDVMAGENVDVTGATADRKAALVKQAESFLSALMEFDITAGYAGLSANLKLIFNEYGARYAGMQLIAFNFLGDSGTSFTRIEGEDRVNVHLFRMRLIEDLLKNPSYQDFLGV